MNGHTKNLNNAQMFLLATWLIFTTAGLFLYAKQYMAFFSDKGYCLESFSWSQLAGLARPQNLLALFVTGFSIYFAYRISLVAYRRYPSVAPYAFPAAMFLFLLLALILKVAC